MDFALDPITGDLLVEGGLGLVTGAEELQQQIKVGLTINLNEFFTHTNYGLPWLRDEDSDENDVQYFLGDSEVTVQYIVSEIEDYILSLDRVTEVTSQFSFNKSKRELTYTPYITSEEGDTLDFPPYTLYL